VLDDPRTRSRGFVNVDEALHRLDSGGVGTFSVWRTVSVELWAREFLD
jgi:hypothetical protein